MNTAVLRCRLTSRTPIETWTATDRGIRPCTLRSRVRWRPPTAGLHFSEALLGQLSVCGIEIARVVLHVGPGLLLPVRHEDIRLHGMESETYEISEEAAGKINAALKDARRIIAALDHRGTRGGVLSVGDRCRASGAEKYGPVHSPRPQIPGYSRTDN